MKFIAAFAAAAGAVTITGQPRTTTMQPGVCFYLKQLTAQDNEDTPLALNCEAGSGCKLDQFTWDDKQQQFWWNLDGNNLISYYPNGRSADRQYLKVGAGNNLVSTATAADGQALWYNQYENSLTFDKNKLHYEITVPQTRKWAAVKAAPWSGSGYPARSDSQAKWRIEYCHHEDKPNPENTPEGIPQNLNNQNKYNSFPEKWYEAGSQAIADV